MSLFPKKVEYPFKSVFSVQSNLVNNEAYYYLKCFSYPIANFLSTFVSMLVPC